METLYERTKYFKLYQGYRVIYQCGPTSSWSVCNCKTRPVCRNCRIIFVCTNCRSLSVCRKYVISNGCRTDAMHENRDHFTTKSQSYTLTCIKLNYATLFN